MAYTMTDEQIEALKPCPFCGSEEQFAERADYSSCYIICNDCSARGPVSCDENEADADASEAGECEPGEMAARRLWNTRASTDTLDADSGMSGDAATRAEMFWANLPTRRKWTELATHEKALVCHQIARIAALGESHD